MRKILVAGVICTGIGIPLLSQPSAQAIKNDCVEFKDYNNFYNEYLLKYEEVQIQKETQRQLEEERLRQEELERIRIEEEKAKIQWVEFELTFYTTLSCENSEYGSVNCLGEPLSAGMVANNTIQLGTEIYLEDWGTVEVRDRGGSSFNSSDRLDVLVMRNYGESDSEYYKRVNNMGRVKTMGYIIK